MRCFRVKLSKNTGDLQTIESYQPAISKEEAIITMLKRFPLYKIVVECVDTSTWGSFEQDLKRSYHGD